MDLPQHNSNIGFILPFILILPWGPIEGLLYAQLYDGSLELWIGTKSMSEISIDFVIGIFMTTIVYSESLYVLTTHEVLALTY